MCANMIGLSYFHFISPFGIYLQYRKKMNENSLVIVCVCACCVNPHKGIKLYFYIFLLLICYLIMYTFADRKYVSPECVFTSVLLNFLPIFFVLPFLFHSNGITYVSVVNKCLLGNLLTKPSHMTIFFLSPSCANTTFIPNMSKLMPL